MNPSESTLQTTTDSECKYGLAPRVVPRIGVEDPYERLGVGKEATPFKCVCAWDILLTEFGDQGWSRESIEAAYEDIRFEKVSNDFVT